MSQEEAIWSIMSSFFFFLKYLTYSWLSVLISAAQHVKALQVYVQVIRVAVQTVKLYLDLLVLMSYALANDCKYSICLLHLMVCCSASNFHIN